MNSEKSIVKNYLLNLIKTASGLLFPVITFAYSSRILGVEGIGKISFTKSYISYFTMLALLGMNYYGTREAAKLRDDKKELSKFVHEMLFVNLIMVAIAYLLLVISVGFIPRLRDYGELLAINSIAIILQGLGMEWFYQAMEEYRYIAVRSIIFQCVALLLMFLFVRKPSDVLRFAGINVFASFGFYIFNFINIRKYVLWHWLGNYEIRKHVKPLMILFAMAVSIQLYAVLDSTMLGFIQGDIAVGRYTAAIRINKLTTTMITALGIVLVPRLSYYIGQQRMDKVRGLIDKSYNFVFLLSVPACLGLFVLSDELLFLFSGREFLKAAVTLKLLTPIVVVIPFNVITNTQTFVPMGKEKLILMSTVSGAVTNIFCNLFLIPSYAENGAALATVLAESVIAAICFGNIRYYFDVKRIFRLYHEYWIAAFSILPINCVVKHYVDDYLFQVIITVILSCFSYGLILCLFKNAYVWEGVSQIKYHMKNVLENRGRRKNGFSQKQ